MDRVVFLDRDGTINTEVNYLYKTEELEFLPGVPEALARLYRAGFKLVVVSNQAGVGRGYYTEHDVDKLHQYMNGLLKKSGAVVEHFFYCPHHPEHGVGEYKVECRCRKPEIGMFEMAERYLDIDKKHSYMVGDKLADTRAGRNYGISSILVGTGYGREFYENMTEAERPEEFDFYGNTLSDVVDYIEEKERNA